MRRNRRAGISMCIRIVVAIACSVSYTQAQSQRATKDSTPPTCIGPRNKDANLDKIVSEVFEKKPKELLQQKIITQEFFDAVHKAQYEICDDRTWEVETLPRTAPLVVYDS